MQSVIKSLLNKTSESKEVEVLERILDPETKEILTPQEEDILLFLRDSLYTSKVTPSESYLVSKYPECTSFLKNAKVLDENDLKVHCGALITKRRNLNTAKVLMTVSSEVTKSGLTSDHVELVRSCLVHSDADVVVNNVKSVEAFQEYYENKKHLPKGLKTYVQSIDERIGGIAPSTVATIAGFTGSFKSTFAVNIAYNNAMNGYNVCYVSLEMPKEDLMFDILSRHSADKKFNSFGFIGHNRIRYCTMDVRQEKQLMEVVAPDYYKTVGKHLTILDETDFRTFSFAEIRERLEAVDDDFIERTGKGLDACVFDHANLFKFNGASKRKISETAEGNEYVAFIRKLAVNFRMDKKTKQSRKLAMIILVQTNREGWKNAVKEDGRYTLTALAEINEVERASQIIMTIFTDDELKKSKEARVCLLKNRNGVTLADPVDIYVDPECYFAGTEVQGFSNVVSLDDINEVFGNTDPNVKIEQLF